MIASTNFVCSSDGEDNQTLFSQSFLVTLWDQGLVRYEGFSLLLQKLLSLMNARPFFFFFFDFSATNRDVEISTRTSLLIFIKQQDSKYPFQVFFSLFLLFLHILGKSQRMILLSCCQRKWLSFSNKMIMVCDWIFSSLFPLIGWWATCQGSECDCV